jgi:hypothetical protein
MIQGLAHELKGASAEGGDFLHISLPRDGNDPPQSSPFRSRRVFAARSTGFSSRHQPRAYGPKA